jgi:hypothetical protein
VVHELLHQRTLLVDQLLVDGEHTADIVRPLVAGHVEDARIARDLRDRPERLASRVGIDLARVERRRHLRGRHLHELHVTDRHAVLPEHPPHEQVIDREAARNRDAPPAQILEALHRRVGADHDDRSRPMAEGDDLGRHAAVDQVHHHRRQQVRRLHLAGHERLLELGLAAVLAELRDRVGERHVDHAPALGVSRHRHTGDRKREVSRHGKPADGKGAGLGRAAERSADVDADVQRRHHDDPGRDCQYDSGQARPRVDIPALQEAHGF